MAEASKVRANDALYERVSSIDAGQFIIAQFKRWVVGAGVYTEARDSLIVDGTLQVDGRLYFK